MQDSFSVSGQIVDVLQKRIFSGTIDVQNGKIQQISPVISAPQVFILPGFIDAHVHIESSMLTPCQFARLAVVHGTVATVSDPHEIGNVLGVAGVRYMVENAKKVPFKFAFGAPSCVPATSFETAGAEIDAKGVEELLRMDEIYYLAEMMNWPGVLFNDADVYQKIALAHKYGKPVDGHAPGLRGEQARIYAAAGITTDHESFTREEALDKLACGMKILIREGSAAKNFEALIDLVHEYPEQMMFCSDDKHPDSLVNGHINQLVQRAIAKGCGLFKVLQAACVNPVQHYKLPVGLLQTGDPADFIIVNNLTDFQVLQTYINGDLVAENGQTRIASASSEVVNRFHTSLKTQDQFIVKAKSSQIPVMEAIDGQLITNRLNMSLTSKDGLVQADMEKDILKITVVNRYADAPPALDFIRNFGLKKGAIASSVAHDSHNIIAVGVDDASICQAVNLLIEAQGGVVAVNGTQEMFLPLPIAGIMSGEDGYWVAQQYEQIDRMAKELGSTLQAPFMTLSFMALLVIPALKLSDKGLFDGEKFEFVR